MLGKAGMPEAKLTRRDCFLASVNPDLSFEVALWQVGVEWVAGVDEAGRGALAGPVAAAAVVLPAEIGMLQTLAGVRDSKQMTPTARAFWAPRIKEIALSWGIGFASHAEIDRLGIVPATRLAVQRALDTLTLMPQHLLVDYLQLPGCQVAYTPLVKGDARCLSIAAASVLAKTSRDTQLCDLDEQYPGYGFARHKGYGTAAHRAALACLGASSVHRRSFAPLK